MPAAFELQGHRGARGLRPENTLPSFEAALDAGVTAIETDLHLTSDGVVVLSHDPRLAQPPCSPTDTGGAPPLSTHPVLRELSLTQVRCYRADGNPDHRRFPRQQPTVGPASAQFTAEAGLHPFALPTLDDLFRFAAAYAGDLGLHAGKSQEQRQRAGRLQFDLELKRVPFHPQTIRDGYMGDRPGLLEEAVVRSIREAGVVGRTTVRSFDHRCVRFLKEMQPALTGAVLVADAAPVDPAGMARAADAAIYCPGMAFLDADIVRRAHAGAVRVIPWTVNEEGDWQRLLDFGVDGITTDYPDRLAAWLAQRGVPF
jgi:glycerophosphoryl diester phosphodiesterase